MAQDGKDSAGVTLALTNTVNLVGTVTGINLSDPHFNDIEVTLTNPTTAAVDSGPRKDGMPQMDFKVPGSVKKIYVHSSMLTKV